MSSSPKSPLLLTGMHRSNTSFLAKAFQDAGLNIGANLIAPDAYNQEGHFEDADFVAFHQHLIKKYKLQSRTSLIDYDRCTHFTMDDIDRDRARYLITSKEANNDYFGWKDPRSCHFLNFWKTLIPHLKCVFIIREPHNAVSSIIKRHTQRGRLWYRPDLWYRYHRFWRVCNQQILDFYKMHSRDCLLIFTPEDIRDPMFEQSLNQTLHQQWMLDLRKVQLSKNYNQDLVTIRSDASTQRVNRKSIELYHRLKDL